MSTEPELTIVIPVYNEGDNILETLKGIRDNVTIPHVVSIVYDFEEDSTLSALRNPELGHYPNLQTIRNAYGRGVLNAIKTGLETAQTELIIVTMADLSDPPDVMNAMVSSAKEHNSAIVCASRYMKGGSQLGGPRLKGLMSRAAGLLLCWIARLPTHDPTNSFKLYRRSFLKTVEIESAGGFEIGLELVVKAHKQGFAVTEVPTVWRDRVAGNSNFKLLRWLPDYLRWFFYAFLPSKRSP